MTDFQRALLTVLAPYIGLLFGGFVALVLIAVCRKVARWVRRRERHRRGVASWDVVDVLDEMGQW